MLPACRPWRSAAELFRAALVLAAVLAACPAAAAAQNVLPAIDITLVVRVRDVNGWLALQNEVLGRVPDVRVPLALSLNAGTGGRRTLIILEPRFATEMLLTAGTPSMKVGVMGKMAAAEALRGLATFQQAASEIQAGLVENRVTLAYGLFSVDAQLIELHISR
jgi:hypothetical protein